MKQLSLKFYIFFAVIMFASTIAYAQKNFEGKIIYTWPAFMDSKPDTQVVYFGKQKIKIDNRIYDFKLAFFIPFILMRTIIYKSQSLI